MLPTVYSRQSRYITVTMEGNSMRTIFIMVFLLLDSWLTFSQDAKLKATYDFSASREQKIKLAESAAPPEISGKATVYVLERSGYEQIRQGTNGFSCLVDRQTPWNNEPTCFDAEGTATTLPTRLFVEQQRAKGKTEDEIKSELADGYKSGRFKAPAKPGIVYMLSDSIFLMMNDRIVHAPPHLMFYAPYATEQDLGSPPPARNMPRLIRAGQPDAYVVVMPGPA
jgi:hypothetical protein